VQVGGGPLLVSAVSGGRCPVADNWSTTKAKVQKILGKDAKIPEPKSLKKVRDDMWSAFAGYQKSCGDLEDKILALQKAGASVKLTLKQYGDEIDDEAFGLNEKDKEDAKKIKGAHDLLKGWADDLEKGIDDEIDELDELDKHVIDFKKYKPKQPST
jgi:hypothetical protein